MAYHMIGGDGKEYGPFSADELRTFVADGRAAAQTQIRADDATAWSALGETPEFAALFTAAPPPALTPAAAGVPPPVPAPAAVSSQELPVPEYDLDMGGCIGRAWRLLTSDFWSIVGVYALFMLIVAVGSSIPILGYAMCILNSVMAGGLWIFMLKKVRGQTTEVSDIFAGFKQPLFVPLLLVGLVSGLLTFLGLICCILPGIYLSVAWMLALPLVADRKLDFWPAMETSRKTVTRHWWLWLGFGVVLGLVVLAGVLALCVGVFVAGPLVALAMAYAYNDLFGQQPQDQ